MDFPIEQNSLNANAALVNTVWSIAERRGHTAFKRSVGRHIRNDRNAHVHL